METALRLALIRFNVRREVLTRLLHVTSALYRRIEPNTTEDRQLNSVVVVIVDVLSDALRGKCRVTSSTLASLVTVRICLRRRL